MILIDPIQQIENAIRNTPTEKLIEIESKMIIYAAELYHSNDFAGCTRVEYIRSKVEDAIIIRNIEGESSHND